MTEAVTLVKKTFGKVKSKLELIDARMKLHRHQIAKFTPNAPFEFERGDYQIKTAMNGDELERCLKLRYDVFFKEFQDKKRTVGIDIDKLDFLCDHLMINERATGRLVGTYRLNCSAFTEKFYSTGEFHIEKILSEPGIKLELGRACVDKDFRHGSVLTLLWRAIAHYLILTESKSLFGCASIKTTDLRESAFIYAYLRKQGNLDKDYGVVPTKNYIMPGLAELANELEPTLDQDAAITDLIPPLFQSYLKMGVRVCGEPALDRDFRCIDFLTLLKMDELNPLFLRRYKL